ncbi:MAG TPA: hypothetical protein VEC35_09480 [Noviherbaspirillum sp.]|nr:hypothetical protein [Noviherbaspirillum sp.]
MAFNIRLWFASLVFKKRRARIYEQIAFALERGAPPIAEIAQMYSNAVKRHSSVAAVYNDWLEKMRGTTAGRLAPAMKSTIGTNEYALIASAEETNTLAEGLKFLADSALRIEEMQRAVVDAVKTVWIPAVLLLTIFWGVDEFFFPMLTDSIPRKEWPFLTKIVSGVTSRVGSIVSFLMFVAPVIVVAWYLSLSRWGSRAGTFWDRTPLYSKYRDFQCALFLTNLAFLMNAGHPPRESLERMLKYSTAYMRTHIERMLKALSNKSTNTGVALVGTGLFNEEIGDLLVNYTRWTDWTKQVRPIANSALAIVTEDVKKFGPKLQELLQLLIGLSLMVVFAAGAIATAKMVMSSGLTK